MATHTWLCKRWAELDRVVPLVLLALVWASWPTAGVCADGSALGSEAVLSGSVRAGRAGEALVPAREGEVRAYSSGEGLRDMSVTRGALLCAGALDSRGVFSLRVSAERQRDLLLQAVVPGCCPSWLFVRLRSRSLGGLNMQVVPAAIEDLLVLQPGGQAASDVSVALLSGDLRAIPPEGAVVVLSAGSLADLTSADTWEAAYSPVYYKTDGTGRIRVQVPDHGVFLLQVREGGACISRSVVRLSSERLAATSPWVVVLPHPMRIVLEVDTEHIGRYAWVKVGASERKWTRLEATVDLGCLDEPLVNVLIEQEGRARWEKRLALVGGENRLHVSLLPEAVARGRVVTGRDDPVARARVRATAGQVAMSDLLGAFVLRGLPPGRVRVEVGADGYLAHSVVLDPSEGDTVVRLVKESAIEFEVRLGDVAELGDLEVSVSLDERLSRHYQTAMMSRSQHVRLGELQQGTYRLFVVRGRWRLEMNVTVPAEATVNLGELLLPPR